MLRFPLVAFTNQQLSDRIINCRRALIFLAGLLLPALLIDLYFLDETHPQGVNQSNAVNSDDAYWTALRNLPPQDYKRLFNVSNFEFCMQQPQCAPQVKAIIMIPTAPGNLGRRLSIRSTWASVISNMSTHEVRLLFVLGQTKSKTQQHKLERENTRFHDMVQGNFVDVYRNLSYKHLAAFKWFIYYCPHAQFLLKLDDDCFLNTFLLYRFLNVSKKSLYNSPMEYIAPAVYNFFQGEQSIFCRKLHLGPVLRSVDCKWYVSYSEYIPEYYPDYCSGYAVIYPAGVVLRLYNAAWDSKSFFWIDDVYVTGMLRERIHVPLVDSDALHISKERYEELRKVQQVPERAKEMQEIDTREYMFAWPNTSPEEIKSLWQITYNEWRKRASMTNKTTN